MRKAGAVIAVEEKARCKCQVSARPLAVPFDELICCKDFLGQPQICKMQELRMMMSQADEQQSPQILYLNAFRDMGWR